MQIMKIPTSAALLMDLAEIIDTKGTQKLEERLVNFSELILS
jgi:hypothetical protein